MKFQTVLAAFVASQVSANGDGPLRSLKTVKSMLTDLSCINGSCVDAKEYQKNSSRLWLQLLQQPTRSRMGRYFRFSFRVSR